MEKRPGPSGCTLVTWVTLQGFLFLLTAEGAESQQDADLSAWGGIELYHCMDRTGQDTSGQAIQQSNIWTAYKNSTLPRKQQRRGHTKLTQSREKRQTIAPCWNLCFSSYTYIRNRKTAKNMESRGSPETISMHDTSVGFASPELITMGLRPLLLSSSVLQEYKYDFLVVLWLLVLPSIAPSLSLREPFSRTLPELLNREDT